MATEVIMPQLGSDMKEGTIVRWVKLEGSEISEGEILAEIETEKAIVELEATHAGVLRKVYAPEGTTAPVGFVIAMLGAATETVPNSSPSGLLTTRMPDGTPRARADASTGGIQEGLEGTRDPQALHQAELVASWTK